MLCFDKGTNQYFITSDEQVKIVESQMNDILKRMISEGKEIITLSDVMDALGVDNLDQNDNDQKEGEPEETKELSNSEFYQLSGVRDGFLDDMIIGDGAKFWTDEKYYYFYDGFVSLRKFYRVNPCKLVLFTFGAWLPKDDIKDVLWQKWEIFGRLE